MSELSTLLWVGGIHWIAMASPGPNVLLVAQTALARSQRAALAAAVGVAAGAALLSTAAVVGLGLVVQQAEWLRDALHVAGGAYLVFLGVQTFRGARDPAAPPGPPEAEERSRRFFSRGLLTNLSNPKSAVFFGSILAPAFDQSMPGWVRVAAVGIIVVDALAWHCLLAVAFGRPGVRRRYGAVKVVVDRTVGVLLALFGVRLAWSGV